MEITVGSRVTVVGREQTPADVTSGLFYPHYGSLSGEVLKVFGQECAVLIDRESLPSAIMDRHLQNEKQQRQRWLDGLSEDARSKLSVQEKDLRLNYAILISKGDLVVLTDNEPSRVIQATGGG